MENLQLLADRHRQCRDEPRRCQDCQAYWPCTYRLRADRELSRTASWLSPTLSLV